MTPICKNHAEKVPYNLCQSHALYSVWHAPYLVHLIRLSLKWPTANHLIHFAIGQSTDLTNRKVDQVCAIGACVVLTRKGIRNWHILYLIGNRSADSESKSELQTHLVVDMCHPFHDCPYHPCFASLICSTHEHVAHMQQHVGGKADIVLPMCCCMLQRCCRVADMLATGRGHRWRYW